MEFLSLTLDLSFSVCFFPFVFPVFLREEGASSRKANPKFPPRNFGPGSCSSPGGGHGSGRGCTIGILPPIQGQIWEVREQSRPAGTIPLLLPGKRDGSQASSSCPGLFQRRCWKQEPGFFMDAFPCVAPEFFSLLAKPGFAPCSDGCLEQRIPLLLSLENRENNRR